MGGKTDLSVFGALAFVVFFYLIMILLTSTFQADTTSSWVIYYIAKQT